MEEVDEEKEEEEEEEGMLMTFRKLEKD